MAKTIILFVTLLLVGGASYFSYTNLNRMKAERLQIHDLEGKIDITSKEISDTRDEKATRKEELGSERRTNGQRTADRDSLLGDISSLKRELPSLDSQIAEQQSEIKKFDELFAELNKIFENLDAKNPEEFNDKIKELAADRVAREKQLAETQALLEAAKAAVAKTEGQISDERGRQADRSQGLRRNSTEAMVMAVNNDWGFVVINVGTAQGFVPDRALVVKRGDEFIANLAITSMQRTQLVADIDYDSVPEGKRVQPGDRVILAKPNE